MKLVSVFFCHPILNKIMLKSLTIIIVMEKSIAHIIIEYFLMMMLFMW